MIPTFWWINWNSCFWPMKPGTKPVQKFICRWNTITLGKDSSGTFVHSLPFLFLSTYSKCVADFFFISWLLKHSPCWSIIGKLFTLINDNSTWVVVLVCSKKIKLESIVTLESIKFYSFIHFHESELSSLNASIKLRNVSLPKAADSTKLVQVWGNNYYPQFSYCDNTWELPLFKKNFLLLFFAVIWNS